MQAIIIATGEQFKLKSLSHSMATPMIPVVNQPIMQYSVELLARQGYKNILVSLHHLAGGIEAYFGEGRRWGVEMEYLLSRDPLGSAGTLRWASDLLTQPFFVLQGDEIIDIDLSILETFHNSHGGPLTVVTAPAGPESRALRVSEGNIVPYEGDSPTLEYNTKTYVCDPSIFEHIPLRQPFDLETDLIPLLIEQGHTIPTFSTDRYWNPILTTADYDQAVRVCMKSAEKLMSPMTSGGDEDNEIEEEFIPSFSLNGDGVGMRYPIIGSNPIAKSVWIGRSNSIHPTVKVTPPICIGDNCQIGREVEIGPYTVIGSNVVIDDEATVANSTIIDNTYVGQLVQVSHRIVHKGLMIDLESGEETRVVDNFLLSEANPQFINSDARRVQDTIVSLFLLLVTAPLLLIIGLIAFIGSGRIFQRVVRYGVTPRTLARGGQPGPEALNLLRFRTERNGQVTATGRFLENWDLHRIPQLYNVLIGDMGLIGVKPLTREELDQLNEAWQKKRFEYNVGFTGSWFNELDQESSLDELLINDAYYVVTRTWGSDWKILLASPRHWWRRGIQRRKN